MYVIIFLFLKSVHFILFYRKRRLLLFIYFFFLGFGDFLDFAIFWILLFWVYWFVILMFLGLYKFLDFGIYEFEFELAVLGLV